MPLDPESIVRVVNTGTEPFRDFANGKETYIEPGGEVFVPLGSARVWLGVNDENDSEWAVAVEKIRLRWGHAWDSELSWDDIRPQIEVFDQFTGDRIWFPADDPERVHANYSSRAVEESRTDKARIAQLEEKLDLLLSSQNTPAARKKASAKSLADLPPDTAGKTPVRT